MHSPWHATALTPQPRSPMHRALGQRAAVTHGTEVRASWSWTAATRCPSAPPLSSSSMTLQAHTHTRQAPNLPTAITLGRAKGLPAPRQHTAHGQAARPPPMSGLNTPQQGGGGSRSHPPKNGAAPLPPLWRLRCPRRRPTERHYRTPQRGGAALGRPNPRTTLPHTASRTQPPATTPSERHPHPCKGSHSRASRLPQPRRRCRSLSRSSIASRRRRCRK